MDHPAWPEFLAWLDSQADNATYRLKTGTLDPIKFPLTAAGVAEELKLIGRIKELKEVMQKVQAVDADALDYLSKQKDGK